MRCLYKINACVIAGGWDHRGKKMPCFRFFLFLLHHRFNISYLLSFFSLSFSPAYTHTMNPHTSSKKQMLSRIESAFRVTDSQLNDLVLGFNEEMKAGLDITNRATKSSELKMIPSYVTGKREPSACSAGQHPTHPSSQATPQAMKRALIWLSKSAASTSTSAR